MSQLQRLQQQVSAIGQDSKKTAGDLAGFKRRFSVTVNQVSATVGGSAQQVDRQLINSLQTAERQVDAAISALQAAASAASRYAASL